MVQFKTWEKWFLTVALGALFSLPFAARQGWLPAWTGAETPAQLTRLDSNRHIASASPYTEEEEIFAVAVINQNQVEVALGKTNPAQANQLHSRLKQILRVNESSARTKKFKDLVKFATFATQSQITSRLGMSLLARGSLNSEDKAVIQRAGLKQSEIEPMIKDRVNMVRHSFKVLTKKSSYDATTHEWDFTNWGSFFVKDLRSSPSTRTALALLVSPRVVASLEDYTRTEAVRIGKSMFLPPVKKPGANKGKIKVMSFAEWKKQTQKTKQAMKTSLSDFEAAARKAGSFRNLTVGAATVFGLESGNPELEEAEASENAFRLGISRLKGYGVSKQDIRSLLQAYQASLQVESQAFEQALATLNAATVGVALAPLIPIAMALAPIGAAAVAGTLGTGGGALAVMSGGAATFSSAGFAIAGQGAVAMAALLPMAFTVGTSALHANIDGQSPSEFYDALPGTLASGLSSSAAFSMMPIASYGLASGAVALGLRAGSTIETAVMVGAKTKAIIDIGSGMAFLGYQGFLGISGYGECKSLLQKVDKITSDGITGEQEAEQVNQLSNQALKTCYQSGIDLAFSIVPAGHLTYTGVHGWASARKAGINAQRAAELQENINLRLALEITDLPKDFTPAQLKAQYRKLAALYHPDKIGSRNLWDQLDWAKTFLDAYSAKNPSVTNTTVAAASGSNARPANSNGSSNPNSIVRAGTDPVASQPGSTLPVRAGTAANSPTVSAAPSAQVKPILDAVKADPSLTPQQKALLAEVMEIPSGKQMLAKQVDRALAMGIEPARIRAIVAKAVQSCSLR
jgi:hypothetical protein